MTSGERMVFAVAFDRALCSRVTVVQAARFATTAVKCMREALRRLERDHLSERYGVGDATEIGIVDDETRAMLNDMLGTGDQRAPASAPVCVKCGRAECLRRATGCVENLR